MPLSHATAGGRSYPSALTLPQCTFLFAALVALVSMVWLVPTWLISSLASVYVMALVVLAHYWVGQNRTKIEAAEADDSGRADDERGQ